MFNLIVKSSPWTEGHGTISLGRVLEYTDPVLAARFKPGGVFDVEAVKDLPTLFLEETGREQGRFARVGTIHRIRQIVFELEIEISFDSRIRPVANEALQGFAGELGIEAFEFARNHWAIKDRDLFKTLLRHPLVPRQTPQVFDIPQIENVNPCLLSVMMPFDGSFSRVYRKIKAAAESANFTCKRADDIWENYSIIQDVVSLIDQSSIVICNCTGRNSNVFYEMGIAHTLGREVIVVTQNASDIPFDIRHLRYIPYVNNAQGLRELSAALSTKIRDIASVRR